MLVNFLRNHRHCRCKALLTAHRRELEIVAKGLLEYESLAGSEIVDLIDGKALGSGVRSQRPSRATKPLPGAVPVVSSTSSSVTSGMDDKAKVSDILCVALCQMSRE